MRISKQWIKNENSEGERQKGQVDRAIEFRCKKSLALGRESCQCGDVQSPHTSGFSFREPAPVAGFLFSPRRCFSKWKPDTHRAKGPESPDLVLSLPDQ